VEPKIVKEMQEQPSQ